MLSLVSYGSSGESEDEDNSEYSPKSFAQVALAPDQLTEIEQAEDDEFNDEKWKGDSAGTKKISSSNTVTGQVISDEAGGDLLSKLPAPVSDLKSIPWDQLSKLTYKSRAIRIMAPEIPEDTEEKKEKKVASKTGSGLLAMLPKPRSEFKALPTQLKPTSVTRCKPPSTVVKSKPLPQGLPSIPLPGDHTSDSEGESEATVDFFSLTNRNSPEPSSDDTVQIQDIPTPTGSAAPQLPPPPQPLPTIPPSQVSQSCSYDYVGIQQPDDQLELDNEALAALCGSRGLKRKAGRDEFKIIDINSSELTPDSHELLTKNLTADQPRPQKNNKDGPTSQQKRKHQIIYLAHQAKEQELELQNTWANNRMSKKQTQAKYGF